MGIGEKPLFLRDIPVEDLLDAKIHTADFLAHLGLEENNDAEIEAQAAHAVFAALTEPANSTQDKRQAIALLETPEAVRKLVGMLTAYEWEYVQEANRIRSFLTASLLEDCTDPDPRVRLKAIELVGKIKEVALFEERVVTRRENMTDDEINTRLRDLIARQKALATPPKEDPVDIEFKEKT